LKEKRQKT